MTAQPFSPTSPAPDANDVLMGGARVPTAKFDAVGVVVGGRIVAPPKAHQEREYDRNNPGQGRPKTFPSGDPIYGLTIDVQTDQRDPSIEDDTGVRRIYVEGKRMKEAVRNAVQQAGAAKLEIGGTLEVVHTGVGQAASAGVNPPKEYQARYTPPAGGGNQTDFFNQGQQQPTQPAAPPQWAQAPAPQAAAPQDPWASQAPAQPAPVAPPAGQPPAQQPAPTQQGQQNQLQLPPGVQMTPELQAALAAANAQPQG